MQENKQTKMDTSNDIDILGKFLMENLRDVSIQLCNGLLESKYESPNHKKIQEKLKLLSSEQKELVKEVISYCIDGGINDFLYDIDEASRKNKSLQLFVNGNDTSKLTQNLNKELHGDNGWKRRFSRYK